MDLRISEAGLILGEIAHLAKKRRMRGVGKQELVGPNISLFIANRYVLFLGKCVKFWKTKTVSFLVNSTGRLGGVNVEGKTRLREVLHGSGV
jgi:hypothetical protein